MVSIIKTLFPFGGREGLSRPGQEGIFSGDSNIPYLDRGVDSMLYTFAMMKWMLKIYSFQSM